MEIDPFHDSLIPLERFANLLYCSDGASTYRGAGHLIAEGAPILKVAISRGKKYVLGRKNAEKKTCIFWVFRHNSRKTLRKFEVRLRLSSNLQGSRWIDFKGWANNKIGLFEGRKLRFEPKNFKKWGLLGSQGLHWKASKFHCITPVMLKLTAWALNQMGKVLQQ